MQQIFGKLGGFFSTNVNPLALTALNWKYMAIYCGWIAFEFIFIYLFYPETYNRTLEELAFRKIRRCLFILRMVLTNYQVFEDKELSNQTTAAVEKQIHFGGNDPSNDQGAVNLEDQPTKQRDIV